MVHFVCTNDPQLEPILKRWCKLQKRYAKIEDEAAYDHSECANTSLLVAAANTQKGYTGIAEHWVSRGLKKKGSRSKAGLADAYIGNGEKGFYFEFKQIWTKSGRTKPITGNQTRSRLKAAKQQAETIKLNATHEQPENFRYFFGGHFVLEATQEIEGYTRRELADQLSNYCKDHKMSHMAIYFPKLEPELLIGGRDRLKRIGIAMAFQEI